MKGIVFTEFIEMVDATFGEDVTEEIIETSGVEGIYTSIGTYPHSEMVQLVGALSDNVNIPIPSLLEAFGEYMFSSFSRLYPSFFEHISDPLSFIEHVEDYIHREVIKIYPEAELPSIKTKRLNVNSVEMIYTSDRRMSDLAVGLIRGCFKHFNTPGDIQMTDSQKDGSVVTFLISSK